MDDANITRASSTGQISSLLLGHLFSPTSSTSFAPTSASSSPSRLGSVPPPHWGRQIPSSSFTSTLQNRGATTQGGAAALSSAGFDPAAFLRSGAWMGPPAVELDAAYDGESEEGGEVSEGRPKPTPTRSGSKRTRAAEVHNLSEKRRRSRINEKMRALQNLIPNSNKTDKASMLDEAIEYLKHLQLQVQMLSMRNGLSLQSMYLPSTLQAVQASQMHPGVSVNNSSSSNMGVGMMPAARASSSQSSFEISKHCTTAHQHMMPTTALTNAVTSIGMDALQFQHEAFPFSLPTEMYKEDTMRQSHLDTVHVANNMSDNEMNSMNIATTVPFEGEAPSTVDANLLDGCNLSCGKSEHLPSKGQQHQVLMQHLHSFQTGKGAASSDGVKVEMLEFR